MPLGLVLALARLSRWKALSGAVNGYIWLMRGTPLMLQMLFIYFALPFVPVVGVRLPDFPAAVTAFALNYAAYFAEIFRAGHPVRGPGPVRGRQGARHELRPDHAPHRAAADGAQHICRP
ncbi:polar amino acid ABC transporter permease [Alicycliphilus sp. B1]|nr:polar amino acid ABC transporter permease [Alicycliphilus sp. B1]